MPTRAVTRKSQRHCTYWTFVLAHSIDFHLFEFRRHTYTFSQLTQSIPYPLAERILTTSTLIFLIAVRRPRWVPLGEWHPGGRRGRRWPGSDAGQPAPQARQQRGDGGRWRRWRWWQRTQRPSGPSGPSHRAHHQTRTITLAQRLLLARYTQPTFTRGFQWVFDFSVLGCWRLDNSSAFFFQEKQENDTRYLFKIFHANP